MSVSCAGLGVWLVWVPGGWLVWVTRAVVWVMFFMALGFACEAHLQSRCRRASRRMAARRESLARAADANAALSREMARRWRPESES